MQLRHRYSLRQHPTSPVTSSAQHTQFYTKYAHTATQAHCMEALCLEAAVRPWPRQPGGVSHRRLQLLKGGDASIVQPELGKHMVLH